MNSLLQVKNLKTYFRKNGHISRSVDDVSFHIAQGEALCLVGESGCGKSVTALSILRLIAAPGWIESGEILFNNKDLLALPENEIRKVRGNGIAMIFQEPMTTLNPVFTCGDQIREAILTHQAISRAGARRRTIEMLEQVGLPDAERLFMAYPHELSGGMRQRVMIAMALIGEPALLMADEPTTALDVTVQAQILELIRTQQRERNMALMLITHDFGVVAETADRVAVMYASKIVETSDVKTIFKNPMHPYTLGLLRSIPRIDSSSGELYAIPGQVPHPTEFPPGCHFAPRCPLAFDRCQREQPELQEAESGHQVACFAVANNLR